VLELERLEFRRMLILSVAAHLGILGVLLATTTLSPRKRLEFGSPGPMNVLWARTLRAPEETAPNKLPGPAVSLPQEAEESPERPSYVMAEQGPKLSAAEEARRRMMAEAVAGIRRNIDDRPVPSPDNFPSKGGAEKGLPGNPGGSGGILSGNPLFSGYKGEIKRIIEGNFIWVRPREERKAEVTFRIDGNGNILDPSVSKSSGDPSFDSAALRAIRKSSPLPPPPGEIASDLVGERFVLNFDPGAR
jgi:TonB family protein